jgi:hypothetical protein
VSRAARAGLKSEDAVPRHRMLTDTKPNRCDDIQNMRCTIPNLLQADMCNKN